MLDDRSCARCVTSPESRRKPTRRGGRRARHRKQAALLRQAAVAEQAEQAEQAQAEGSSPPAGLGGHRARRWVQASVDGVHLIGSTVLIQGLIRSPEFNGQWGYVESYDPQMQRYLVSVVLPTQLPGEAPLYAKLRRDNLCRFFCCTGLGTMGIEVHVHEVLKPLEKIQVACDNTGIIMLSVLGVLTLGVCFFGFGLQAAVGSAWVQQQDNQDHGITVKIIVVVCAILWGTLFLMLARRYYDSWCAKLDFQEVIQKVLGFLVGVCLGVAITILAVSLAEKPLEENLAQYAGWERFAAVTLGVPIALLTGYVCRNFVKYLIMLLTAVVGAAGLWKCGTMGIYDDTAIEGICSRLRVLVQDSFQKHLYVSAIFFADQLVSLQGPQPEEIYTLAECYFKNREYRRVLHLLKKHNEATENSDRLKLLVAQSLIECRDWEAPQPRRPAFNPTKHPEIAMGLNGVLAPSYNGVAEPPKSLQHQEIALLKGLKLHKEDEWLRHLYAAKLTASRSSDENPFAEAR
eukprot:g11305.t1